MVGFQIAMGKKGVCKATNKANKNNAQLVMESS